MTGCGAVAPHPCKSVNGFDGSVSLLAHGRRGRLKVPRRLRRSDKREQSEQVGDTPMLHREGIHSDFIEDEILFLAAPRIK